MAGFSINLKLLVQFKDAYFSPFSNNYLEGAFLENFVTLGEMEAKAESCTKVSRTYSKSCFLVIIQKSIYSERNIIVDVANVQIYEPNKLYPMGRFMNP